MPKHVHHDLIVEWAATGCEVEYFDDSYPLGPARWALCEGPPTWHAKVKYRLVKPKKYRWVMQQVNNPHVMYITNHHYATAEDANKNVFSAVYKAIHRLDFTEIEG